MSEYLFTTHRHVIEFEKFGEPIYLIPIGDIHRHSPMCSVERWHEFLDWARTKKRCWFIGMGDYDDFASTSERKILYDPNLHESSSKTIQQMCREHTLELCKELAFTRGRWVGMLEGNHYGCFSNGTTTTQLMCEKLEAEYLGYSSFIRLCFRNGTKSSSLDLWANHGKGAGRLVGSSVNNVQYMAEHADADLFLSGHDHKKWVALKSKLCLTMGHNNILRLKHKKILLGRTGSFLKGYEPGEESYVAKAGMSPTDLGVIKIELTPKRILKYMKDGPVARQDVFEVDIHASL